MTGSAILRDLEPRYDAIVGQIYQAARQGGSWLRPIEEIAGIFRAWAVQLLGVNKRTGVMSFSFESGSAPPAAPIEYLRYYHRIDPRLGKIMPVPAGVWMACEEHFDDAFVSLSPFYQDYLIPMGARYLYGTKLHDDENACVLIGCLSRAGNPPLTPEEKTAFRRLSEHFRKALDIQQLLASADQRKSVAIGLLEKMRQPIMLLDGQRRITYRNAAGVKLLERGDIVVESAGRLVCVQSDDDLALTFALRDLVLVPNSTHGDQVAVQDRRSLRLQGKQDRKIAATLLALRPEGTLGGFGRIPQALFTLFEPGAAVDIDPFILSTTFGLTPAEARLAAKIVNGHTPEECARLFDVKLSTVRSQLLSIFGKTGASGQVELVRLVLSAEPL